MFQLIFYSTFAVVFLLWMVYAGKSKSKWGVNLKRVVCPVCKTKQPSIRVPASSSEAMWGDTTCPSCKTKLDKYGKIIS